MSDQERDIVDVFEQLREEWTSALRTAIPATVTAYDPSTQLAEVQPLIMQVIEQSDGTRATRPYAVVPGCPVIWRGSVDGTYAETFPLKPGDTGLLWLCHASIDAWIGLGRSVPVDPQDDRHHDISDGIFEPGVRNKANALASVATDAWVIAAPKIRLGSVTANKKAATNDDLAQLVSILAGVTAGPGSGDAAIAALQSYVASHLTFPAGASKVNVE